MFGLWEKSSSSREKLTDKSYESNLTTVVKKYVQSENIDFVIDNEVYHQPFSQQTVEQIEVIQVVVSREVHISWITD